VRLNVLGGGFMKRRLVVPLGLALFQCLLSVGAAGQTANSCIATNLFFWGDVIPPGWVCGPGEGPYSMLCTGPSGKCPQMSWCPTCQAFVPVGGKPINLTNGNTYIQEVDVKVPGLGNGLMLQRTWNSVWPSTISNFQTGMFGPNWRSSYEERVFLSGNYMVYLRGDGSYWFFGTSNGSTWTLAAPANVVATLTQGSTYWTLTFQNGEQRQFSVASGSLTALIDRNGNTTQLSYDSENRLVTVTDPVGRHLYFSYLNNSGNSPVSSVTSDIGLTLSYTYDSQGRLTQVTKPDLTTISFQYNTSSLITAVLDTNGNTLESHTYDSQGRGLTSSRASGVESVTVSYQ
jgi:YD repeat-containing protein